jgi:hypothetical protein
MADVVSVELGGDDWEAIVLMSELALIVYGKPIGSSGRNLLGQGKGDISIQQALWWYVVGK